MALQARSTGYSITVEQAENAVTGRLIDAHLQRLLLSEVLVGATPNVSAALRIATVLSNAGCRPAPGHALSYLRTLATVGLVDATVARVVEPHLDACAILAQAGLGTDIGEIGADDQSTWGVYAAHARGHQLRAGQTAGGWTLTGTKPWCSLSQRVSHAVITADAPEGGQRAFAVRLDPELVTVAASPWVARGLAAIPSGPIAMTALPAVAVGPVGWYLDRPGFAWGAVGVAAVWYGIALGLKVELQRHAAANVTDRIMLAQLGSVDETLFAAAMCLERAAQEIDDGVSGQAGILLAQRVRAVTVRAAEAVLHITTRALGPGPLVGEESYARRVADLGVYLRQHHGERDLAYLGQLVVDAVGESHA